jgi:tetratricopeptide (TPR) repeat protein
VFSRLVSFTSRRFYGRVNRLFRICTFCLLAAGAPAVLGIVQGQTLQAPIAPQDLSQRSQGSTPTTGATPATGSIIPRNTSAQTKIKTADSTTPYNEGVAFLKAKNYAAALTKFEAALKANSSLPQAHLLAAFCLRKLGPANYDASLQHLNAALKLNPDMGEAYESRGVLYVKMGKKENAQKDLATLKQLNPKLTPGLEAAIKSGKDVDTY